jgi:macrolide transport system ATP-binding/permease protein
VSFTSLHAVPRNNLGANLAQSGDTRGPEMAFRSALTANPTRTPLTLATINPNLSVVKFQTFDAQISDRFKEERMIARLTMLFGALALVLAAVGMYGVTAYTVAHIGDRHPHGARRRARRRGGDGDALCDDPDGVGAGDRGSGGTVLRALCESVTSADASVLTSAILTLAVAACVAD